MKTRIFVPLFGFVACLLVTQPLVEAASPPGTGGPFGLGITLGYPTGITGKYWVKSNQAVDFALGVETVGHDGHGALSADYLFHFDVGAKTEYFNMPIYLGPGAALLFGHSRYCAKWSDSCWSGSSTGLAARMPLGIAFLFTKFSGEAFLELTPTLLLFPTVYFDINPALGFRFYF